MHLFRYNNGVNGDGFFWSIYAFIFFAPHCMCYFFIYFSTYFFRSYPVALAIGMRPGDVCKIDRPSKSAIHSTYYRVCVQ